MAEANQNARIEAFSDGVFAIALTLLILDIKLPETLFVTNADFWQALSQTIPSIFAFILSFIIIYITWVNHHNSFNLVKKLSSGSMYANGFLLLTIVFLPFPTMLLGRYLLTSYAGPAVTLYNAVIALQSVGWIMLGRSAIKNNAEKSEKALVTIRQSVTYGYYALGLYTLCAVLAFWFPFSIAMFTTLTWIFWLILSLNTKHE